MQIQKNKLRASSESISAFLFILYAFASGGLTQHVYGRYTIALLTLVLAAVLVFFKGLKKFKISVVGLLLIITLLFIFANNQNLANRNYIYEILYVCLVIFFLFGQKSERWMSTFYTSLILFGLFFAFCTILFYFIPNFYKGHIIPLFPGNEASLLYTFNSGYMPGFTSNYSTNGTFLAVPLGACVAYALINLKRQRKILIIVFTILLIALLMTGKRAHLLIALISLFVMYYNYSCDKPRGRLFRIIGVSLFSIIIFYIAIQFIPAIANTFNRLNLILQGGDNNVESRLIQYQIAWQTFLQSPLLGKGWDWYKYYYLSTTGELVDVHNVYLQLLCETGVIGSIFFGILFILTFLRGYFTLATSRRNKGLLGRKAEVYLCSALYIETFFILYCFTGSPLHDQNFLIFYFCSITTTEFYYRRIKALLRNKDYPKIIMEVTEVK